MLHDVHAWLQAPKVRDEELVASRNSLMLPQVRNVNFYSK